MLPSFGGLKRLYLRHFAKPAHDQTLYRFVHRHRVAKLAQLGLGNLERTLRLIDVIEGETGGAKIELVGVDKFEMRSAADGAGLPLKAAHRLLAAHEINSRLLPGDPLTVLTAAANSISQVDLLLIAADQDRDSLTRAWFYVPRMLSAAGAVFVEEPQGRPDEFIWRQVGNEELARLAARPRTKRAA